MTTHQSHSETEKGQTDSAHKLTRLKLPADLAGKSVLDIGCNEGFFCRQAELRGAAQVLGIDADGRFLAEAARRYTSPVVQFRETGWNALPDGRFDVILWTSAMHYELDPVSVLTEIARHLTDDGMLVLECGVQHTSGKVMNPVIRHDGAPWYPTMEFIETGLRRAGLSFRMVSHAEMVGTDPVPRVVFHARRRKPTVLLVTGTTQQGKSHLAGLLAQSATKVIWLDLTLSRIGRAKWANTDLEKYIQSAMNPDNLGQIYDGIDAQGLTAPYVDILAKSVAATDEMVVIEGYMTDMQAAALKARLAGRAFVWDVRRG